MKSILLKRFVNFVRPQPQRIPITVDEILSDQRGSNIVDQFRDLYYKLGIADRMIWRGIKIIKNPCDLLMLADLIGRIRPAAIVETGTAEGGSALFYSDMAQLLQIPIQVITVDMRPKISYDSTDRGIISVTGYTTDHKIVDQVKTLIGDKSPVMVILDSDHSHGNVLKELELYSPMVTVGSYLVVEDTNINGHPSFPSFGPGPFEAVQEFLAGNAQFECDKECEQHLLTFNPGGYLRRTN